MLRRLGDLILKRRQHEKIQQSSAVFASLCPGHERKAETRKNFSTASSILSDPQFYTALSVSGGAISYVYSEHLRRKEILIDSAKRHLETIKESYSVASKVTFETESELSAALSKVGKGGPHPSFSDIFTTARKVEFAKFAELQYRIILASDTRLTNERLRNKIEDNFNAFITTVFSPQLDSDPNKQKEAITYYFWIHQLIIGYEKSLSSFIYDVDTSYFYNKSYFKQLHFKKLHAEQERFIDKTKEIVEREISKKSPEEALINLTKIFRQSHLRRSENESAQNFQRQKY